TSDLDTLLYRQDLEQLQKLDEEDPEKSAREALPIEDFFETGPVGACRPQASFVSSRSQPASSDDDVFLRPPLWEDITSSIQKLDPENADMLGSQSTLSADPGSPLGGPPRRTPPPPYPQPPMLNPSHRIQSSGIAKFNRRNNPELEKRRVHHCDFIGCTKVYTKSSHLKAHQRIHTVVVVYRDDNARQKAERVQSSDGKVCDELATHIQQYPQC
ncbi:hypothetical protein G9C98_006434, partial [Cotesia typhae]